MTLSSLRGWEGDGVLAMVETDAQRQEAEALGRPVVNLAARSPGLGFCSVLSDNHAIGRAAAEHLAERGFRRFAFYGLKGVLYSEERLAGFQEGAEKVGGTVSLLLTESSLESERPWEWDREALDAWVGSLGSQVGLMAVHDYRARLVLESARRLAVSVPGDLAVLGVNNDPVACEGTWPTLSSIPQDGYAIGVAAAGLLQRLMEGEPIGTLVDRIAPLPLVERRSTDMLGVENVRLRQVLEEMERRVSRSFGIGELAAAAGVSRRWLEHLFRLHLGCTPHEHLVRLRLRRVEKLRCERPELRWSELARLSGFSSARSLRMELERQRGSTGSAREDV